MMTPQFSSTTDTMWALRASPVRAARITFPSFAVTSLRLSERIIPAEARSTRSASASTPWTIRLMVESDGARTRPNSGMRVSSLSLPHVSISR